MQFMDIYSAYEHRCDMLQLHHRCKLASISLRNSWAGRHTMTSQPMREQDREAEPSPSEWPDRRIEPKRGNATPLPRSSSCSPSRPTTRDPNPSSASHASFSLSKRY